MAQQTPPSTIESEIERILRSTVFVIQGRTTNDGISITCVGSGTLVSRGGLVLTNAHNAVQNDACPGDTLIIAMSLRQDEPPVPMFRAQVAQADPGLDLALLQINQDVDGRQIDTEALPLPFVEIGDSNQVNLDSTIVVVGYPGLSDDPVQVTRGTVSGFTAEPSGGDKSWIKTSASIPGLMSGGGAYDQNGRLIGIPTTAPAANLPGTGTCTAVQDTNRDGLVNNNDDCVPVGGFINSLRPSNFARPLFRAASLDLTVGVDGSMLQPTETRSDPPQISRAFFAPSVNEANLPTSVVTSMPTGTNSLYFFFDYANMTPETIYELRVTTNNIPNQIFSLAPVRWSADEQGLWYIGSTGITWPNGVYDFTLFVNGIATVTANLVIGGAPQEDPAISDIVFGLSDIDGNVYGNGFVLPVGSVASARFVYRNIAPGTPWIARWFYNGSEVFRTPPAEWIDGPDGVKTISIQEPNGLLPGNYRLEIYIADRLAATSDFVIAGFPSGALPDAISDVHFATADSPEDAVNAPENSSFIANVSSLYLLFNWQNIAPGTPWTLRWSVDGDPFYTRTLPWNDAESGENFVVQLNRESGLPDGTYGVELLVGSVQLAFAEATVGIGQLPIDTFAQAGGLELRGQILDANSEQGIPGVTFVLITEDFSVADFVWDNEQIYATAVTDRNGRFLVDRALELSTDENPVPYSVVIRAEGYLPIEADGFVVNAETENPLELTIYLQRSWS